MRHVDGQKSVKEHKFKGIAIVGPTASGKTHLALSLAKHLNVEIVCCDSVQVYRRFDIGSAKPTAAELKQAPHHMVDLVDWHESFDAAIYAEKARCVIDDIYSRNRIPLLVGGTGLYFRALQGQAWHADLPKDEQLRNSLQARPTEDLYKQLTKLDPARAKEVHPNDRFRVVRALEIFQLTGKSMKELARDDSLNKSAQSEPLSSETRASRLQNESTSELAAGEFYTIFLSPPRPDLHQRIANRTEHMLQGGLIEEVEDLLSSGVNPECKPMQSIGYKQVAAHLAGTLPREQLAMKIVVSTRQYAKRQCTWFKKLSHQLVTENYEVDAILHLLHDAGVYVTSS